MRVRVEHNFTDYELVEVLEKGLGSAQDELSRPERFADPHMRHLAATWQKVFKEQIERMLERIEVVLGEAEGEGT